MKIMFRLNRSWINECIQPRFPNGGAHASSGVQKGVRMVRRSRASSLGASNGQVFVKKYVGKWYPLNSARTFRRPSFQRTQLSDFKHRPFKIV